MTWRKILFLCSGLLLISAAGRAQTDLTLEQAINQALRANRSLFSVNDSLRSADYSLEMRKADFALMVRPGVALGLSGGNQDETTESLGIGLEFSKKMIWGTRMALTPRAQRFDSSYEGAVLIEITQPLFRGVGKDVTLSGLRSAEFSRRQESCFSHFPGCKNHI